MAASSPPPILVLDAHPDPAPGHLVPALAAAYAEGAREAGRPVELMRLAAIEVPVLRDPGDFATPPPPAIRAAQEAVTRCRHLVVVHPLWLGSMPAYSKAFFEQLFRAEFAMAPARAGRWPRRMLAGRSARVVVTMGMPALAYRVFFRSHGVKGFEGAVLGIAGFAPVRETLIGGAGGAGEAARARWIERLRGLGRRGA